MIMMMIVFVGDDYNDDEGDSNEDGDDDEVYPSCAAMWAVTWLKTHELPRRRSVLSLLFARRH